MAAKKSKKQIATSPFISLRSISNAFRLCCLSPSSTVFSSIASDMVFALGLPNYKLKSNKVSLRKMPGMVHDDNDQNNSPGSPLPTIKKKPHCRMAVNRPGEWRRKHKRVALCKGSVRILAMATMKECWGLFWQRRQSFQWKLHTFRRRVGQ